MPKNKIKEYIVAIDLPLPPSMSGLDAADAQKNTKFRKQLSKKIGHPIKLVGAQQGESLLRGGHLLLGSTRGEEAGGPRLR